MAKRKQDEFEVIRDTSTELVIRNKRTNTITRRVKAASRPSSPGSTLATAAPDEEEVPPPVTVEDDDDDIGVPGSITDAAEELANEAGLSDEELAEIVGTGKNGTILKADVQAYLDSA